MLGESTPPIWQYMRPLKEIESKIPLKMTGKEGSSSQGLDVK
jgi:hypothetical protein